MKNFRIQETNAEQNTIWYLEVTPHYEAAEEGKGKSDAVYFEMGQWGRGDHAIDAGVTCDVYDAKEFARAILETCKEIEGGK